MTFLGKAAALFPAAMCTQLGSMGHNVLSSVIILTVTEITRMTLSVGISPTILMGSDLDS